MRRPGRDPVHPGTAQSSRRKRGEDPEREHRREEEQLRDKRDLPEEHF
ncbi:MULTISPECIES: hypothetical protein [Streptomyces]|nr:hypothetical protein [Streptomyces sp. NBC_01439]